MLIIRNLTVAALLGSVLICNNAVAQGGSADAPAASTIVAGAKRLTADRQSPIDPAAAAAEEMEYCMSAWDKGTHMSKAEWRRTCMHPIL